MSPEGSSWARGAFGNAHQRRVAVSHSSRAGSQRGVEALETGVSQEGAPCPVFHCMVAHVLPGFAGGGAEHSQTPSTTPLATKSDPTQDSTRSSSSAPADAPASSAPDATPTVPGVHNRGKNDVDAIAISENGV